MAKRAFVIGANKGNVKKARSDADKIAKALVIHGYVLPKHPERSVEIISKLDAKECVFALKEHVKDLREGDVFLFYFVGHSFTQEGTLLLALESSDLNDRNTCLRAPDFVDIIQSCKAKHKLIVFDSCKSAAAFQEIKINIPDCLILAAADPWEKVPEILDTEMGIDGGLLSHFFHLAVTAQLPGAVRNLPYLTPANLKDWINEQIQNHDWGFPAPQISLMGIDKNVLKIISLEEDMPFAVKGVVDRLDSTNRLKKNTKLPNYKNPGHTIRAWKAQLQFEEQKFDELYRELSRLRRKRLKTQDEFEREDLDKDIQNRDIEVSEIISKMEDLYKKLHMADFPERLYENFIDFDFEIQRDEWDNYIETAEGIASFVIQSDADYKDIRQQYWLWEHVFLNLLDTHMNIRRLFFFHRHINDIHHLLYEFKKALSPQKYLYDDLLINSHEEMESAIDEVAIDISKSLETQTLVAPLYISLDFPNYSLISDFLEIIWIPICQKIKRQNIQNDNWFLLFIIDNDVAPQNSYTGSLEMSVEGFMPFLLSRTPRVNTKMLSNWLRICKGHKGIFRTHKYLCQDLAQKFSNDHSIGEYLPPCGRVEVLFEKVCKDLNSDYFDLDLRNLINYVREK